MNIIQPYSIYAVKLHYQTQGIGTAILLVDTDSYSHAEAAGLWYGKQNQQSLFEEDHNTTFINCIKLVKFEGIDISDEKDGTYYDCRVEKAIEQSNGFCKLKGYSFLIRAANITEASEKITKYTDEIWQEPHRLIKCTHTDYTEYFRVTTQADKERVARIRSELDKITEN